MVIPLLASIVLLLALPATGARPAQADMTDLRARLIDSVIPSDPQSVARLRADALKHAAALRADGTWADIDYADDERTYWATLEHARRVLAMCKAARITAGAEGAAEPLLKPTLAALDHWLEKDYRNPNWWHNEIGTPQLIGESAVLLGNENLSVDRRERIDAIMARSGWARWTGQNLIWGVTNQVLRGLIKQDDALIARAYARLYDEIVVTTGEGIQRDFSFHQHGAQFYSGGYGLAFATDVARYAAIAWGTRWQIPASKLAVFDGFMLDGQRWMMHYDRFDHAARGREIVRKGQPVVRRDPTSRPAPRRPASALANAVRLLVDQPVPRRAEYRQWLRGLTGEPDAPQPVGNRHYWRSDYMVHHRPGWMASVRMFSNRLINTELVNGEGKKSHHLADGANFLYVTGNEYADLFPAWDWTKVPGTTAEQNTLDFEDGKKIGVKGATRFVGGVSDGACGVSVMHLRRGKLRARKAWFFFDDGYTALGAGIACDTDNPVATAINQCHLSGEVKRGDNWIHHGDVGYVIAVPADGSRVRLSTAAQRGDWSDIGARRGVVNAKVFNLWIDHGPRPEDAGYAYSVYPTASAEQTARRAAEPEVRVVANTARQQAVYHERLKMLGVAFWEAGEVQFADGRTIEVDRPCALMMRDDTLWVSNPENEPATVKVRVDAIRFSVVLPDGDRAGSSIAVNAD